MPFDFPFATFDASFIGWQWLENCLSRKEAFLRGLFRAWIFYFNFLLDC